MVLKYIRSGLQWQLVPTHTHIQSASLPWLGQNEKEKCENVLKNEKQREKKSWKQLKMNEIQITFSYIKLVFSLVVVILNGVAQ